MVSPTDRRGNPQKSWTPQRPFWALFMCKQKNNMSPIWMMATLAVNPICLWLGSLKTKGSIRSVQSFFLVNQSQGLGESFLIFFAGEHGEHGERTGLGVFTEVGSAQMAGITPPSWNCSVAPSLQGDSEKRRLEGTDDGMSWAALTTV